MNNIQLIIISVVSGIIGYQFFGIIGSVISAFSIPLLFLILNNKKIN